ncbi:Gfo/Idh/MocA family protein [Paenibacillus sacheonensis]|uniref:Gfo/Idh/MocA family oxidoreductase n=1 Tax=Paenibacillus sacheonensis TaxID=742054 RepID=A0A7X5BX44_9BACL|nr:Gfo/Idh/MocA family oxidoreductase [Paenibacillus sacheonensis]MBM7563232.1 putative dehydrogenase [Paenibacillus sacheonensis]NBC68207.1 Gfo/Idh/MocA family oxidoreductase [Paenibacillus sacheonensis]
MNDTIGVGILGFAHGHVNAYCEEWKQADLGVRVVAGWDHAPERLEAAVNAYGLEGCDSAETLLAREDVQAVVIASETSRHADLVQLAAAAGKAIILQKPIALTMAEADKIVAAVERHGVPFTLAWQMRVDPQNVQMKAWLQGGELGQVFMVRRRHGLNAGLNADFANTWHVDPASNRDIWADDSSHPADFIHWLLGEPESVTAELASLFNPRIPNDNGIAIYRYAAGPIAEVSCSFTCHAIQNTTEIIGERGTIVQNYGDAPSANAPRPDAGAGLRRFDAAANAWVDSDIASPPNHYERIRGLAVPLAAFLRGEREPLATAEEGRTSLRMVLATYVSSREGRRVSLNDPAVNDV